MKKEIGAWWIIYIPMTWLQYDGTLFVTYLTKDNEWALYNVTATVARQIAEWLWSNMILSNMPGLRHNEGTLGD